MSETCCETSPPSTGVRFGLLVARLVTAGLFLFSGAAKLGWITPLKSIELLEPIGKAGVDPLAFAAAIKGFQVLHNDLIPFATFAIPWTEVVCGLALLLGLGTRGAARIIGALLIIFCLAMVSVIIRDIDVECTCFGKFLGGAVGWLSILRNVVLLVIVWPVAKWGAGMLAVEHVIAGSGEPSA